MDAACSGSSSEDPGTLQIDTPAPEAATGESWAPPLVVPPSAPRGEYEEAAAILTESDEVVMAWVDTEDYPEIPERYGVTGAPVFKFFAKGTVEADKFYYVHYNGRMGNTLLKMLGSFLLPSTLKKYALVWVV